MKKLFIYSLSALFITANSVFALDTVFDSMDKATEVKLAPVIKPAVSNTSNTVKKTISIKEQKFNNALVNLDDAQVELRQELSEVTTKYNEALNEKERILANCKALKKEINDINKKMKNVEKTKKIINMNLQSGN